MRIEMRQLLPCMVLYLEDMDRAGVAGVDVEPDVIDGEPPVEFTCKYVYDESADLK